MKLSKALCQSKRQLLSSRLGTGIGLPLIVLISGCITIPESKELLPISKMQHVIMKVEQEGDQEVTIKTDYETFKNFEAEIMVQKNCEVTGSTMYNNQFSRRVCK